MTAARERLEQQAKAGDPDALEAFLREETRRGNLQKVRDYARVLIYNGRGFTLQFKDGERIHGLEGSCPSLRSLSMGPVRFIEPIEVPLLWSPGRERLFVADCVEAMLPVFECFYGYDPAPLLAGIEGMRWFARGDIGSEELREIRMGVLALSMGIQVSSACAIAEAVYKACCYFKHPLQTSITFDRALTTARDVQPDLTTARKWQGSRLLQYLCGQLEPGLKH